MKKICACAILAITVILTATASLSAEKISIDEIIQGMQTRFGQITENTDNIVIITNFMNTKLTKHESNKGTDFRVDTIHTKEIFSDFYKEYVKALNIKIYNEEHSETLKQTFEYTGTETIDEREMHILYSVQDDWTIYIDQETFDIRRTTFSPSPSIDFLDYREIGYGMRLQHKTVINFGAIDQFFRPDELKELQVMLHRYNQIETDSAGAIELKRHLEQELINNFGINFDILKTSFQSGKLKAVIKVSDVKLNTAEEYKTPEYSKRDMVQEARAVICSYTTAQFAHIAETGKLGKADNLHFTLPQAKWWDFTHGEPGEIIAVAAEDIGTFPKGGTVRVKVNGFFEVIYSYINDNAQGEKYFEN
ncbi:hypothetical protein CHISP_0292 [Chitinispirillum alkaliphilum]|nr:hypothetical protein CHISP_0292 [Chitinispirillum alkaliphilum]